MHFILPDIHGCHAEMLTALEYWNPDKHKLVVLGDLIDRGSDSLLVIRTLMDLKTKYKNRIIILRGNHDDMFVAWLLDTPRDELKRYYNQGHSDTIKSFYNYKSKTGKHLYKIASKRERAEYIRDNFKKELIFLRNLPLFHETDHCIFVHAGINLNLHNWRTDTKAMNTIRYPFIKSRYVAPKRVFFGHTQTKYLNENSNNDIWYSKHNDKVALDGACATGGQLNAVLINNTGQIIEKYIIPSNNKT